MSTINTSGTVTTGWTVPVASRLTMHGITYIPQDQLEDERKKRLSQVAELTAERDQALTSLSYYKDDPDIGWDLMRKQTTLAGLTAPRIRDLKLQIDGTTERAERAEKSAQASSRMYDSMQRERDEALKNASRKDGLIKQLQDALNTEFQEKQEVIRDAERLDKAYQQARKDITYQSGCIHELQETISKVTKERDNAKKEAASLRLQGQIDKVKAIVDDLGMYQLKKPEPKKAGFDFQEAYENLVETHGEVVHMLHRAWNERDEALGRVTSATINIRRAA